MMTSKTHNYECCMCGDHGLSHELFRCKVCHFRSQHRYYIHLFLFLLSSFLLKELLYDAQKPVLIVDIKKRYCSNLYPKAESYRVCNWCLIQKDDNQDTLTSTTSNNTNSPSSQEYHQHQAQKTTIKKPNNNHLGGLRASIGAKSLQPTSPIKKPPRSPESGSPSGRKRFNGSAAAQDKEMLRRTKSEEVSNNNSSSSSRSSGGPAVIKHVFRNKVRRYKLLDEVSS